MNRRGIVIVVVAALAFGGSVRAEDDEDVRLAAAAAAVRRADYRGERAELARLAQGLEGSAAAPALQAPRAYWRGFAYWRRALNGFNETPTPPDLRPDLEAAVASFRSALQARPGWIEAQLGLIACSGSLLYVGGESDPRRPEILAEAGPLLREILKTESGSRNPRTLWVVGGFLMSSPPPLGGQFEKAAATLRRGLEVAREEALSPEARSPLDPAWGAAENLMNLAYLHSHSALTQRDLAFAYAAGALAVVPDWHYVRDVLVPQIEALPAAAR